MRTTLAVCSAVAVLVSVSVCGYRHLTGVSTPAPTDELRPVIECPSFVDLGPQQAGTFAVGEFQIANRGGSPLVMRDVRSSCSCSGLEQLLDGGYQRVERLTIPPGGSVKLTVRVTVGTEYERLESVIYFTTNDPDQPEVKLSVVVPKVLGAGITLLPKAVAFGSVHLGSHAVATVDVYDTTALPRRVVGAVSTQPERIVARLVTLRQPDPHTAAQARGRLIAKIELEAKTDATGILHGQVEVVMEGEPRVFSIPVSGRIIPPVGLSPVAVVFPLPSPGGDVYEAELLASSSLGDFTLTAVECPPDLRVQIDREASAGVTRVRVTATPPSAEVGRVSPRLIRFEARQGDRTHQLEVKVFFNAP